MADIDDLRQQTEELEKIREAYEALKQSSENFSEVLERQVRGEQTIKNLLEEQLGKQADLITAAEVQQQLLDDVLERDKKRLEASKELERLSARENKNLTEQEKLRLKRLQELKQEQQDIFDITEDQVKALEAQKKALDKQIKQQNNIDALLENQVKKTTGLVTSSQNLAQELARTAIEGGNVSEFLDVSARRMRENFTTANLVNSAMAKMGELGDQFNSTMLDANGLLMEFAQADIQFVRDTGLVKELGTEVKNLRFEFNDLNFLADETDQAFRGLTQSFTGFTEVDASVRRNLTEGAAVLERFGVNSDTTGGSIDRFTKALGKTPNAALKSTKEMVKFARALGVGPNKLMGELNQNFEIFAEFGTKKGVDIFKKLQTAAKQTGIEFNKLTGIINKFDQSIEGTMEATGDLNFLLGGPFINSMELLEAEGPEKFEILRNAIEASGKSFDDMGRRQKKAIADVLGTDIEAASRFFSGQAGDIDAATAAIEGQVGEMKDLGKEAAENITLKEKDQLAQEAQVATMQNFADAILKANQTILDLKKTFAPFITILGGIASAASVLFNVFLGYKMLGGAGGAIGGLIGKLKDLGAAAYIVGDDMLKALGGMKTKMTEFVGSAANSAKVVASNWANSAKQTTLSWLSTAKTTALTWAGMAKDAVIRAATTAAGWVSSATATFTAWVTTTAPAFIAAASTMVAAAAPIVLPILAIGAAIAGIVIFWDELVGAFSAGFDFLKEAFFGYLNFIKDGFKMFLHGMVIFAEVIAHALTLPFTAVIEGAAAILDLIPGMGSAANAARAFSPGRIIRTYASEIHGSIDAFEAGTDSTKGGAFIAGDSSSGGAKPELVVAPPMSSVINNKNLQTLASLMNNTGNSAAMAGAQEANIHITLKLDEKVLSQHTEKVSLNTMKEVFNQSR